MSMSNGVGGNGHRRSVVKSTCRLRAILLPIGLLVAWLCLGGHDLVRFVIMSHCQPSPELAGAAGAGGLQYVLTVTFSPDGRLLAGGVIDGVLAVWDMPRGKLRWRHELGSPVSCARFVPHTDSLVVGTFSGVRQDSLVRVWNGHTGKALAAFPEQRGARSLAISPDGRRIAFVSTDRVSVREIPTGDALTDLRPVPEHLQDAVVFRPDGRVLAIGGGTGLAAVLTWWEIGTWRKSATARWSCPQDASPKGSSSRTGFSVRALAYSPSGKYLAVAGETSEILLMDQALKECGRLAGHDGWVTDVAFVPRSALLVSSSCDKAVKVWDVESGRCLRTLRRHWGHVNAVSVSPDGRLIASASNDGTVRVWALRTGRCRNILRPSRGTHAWRGWADAAGRAATHR
ncbi:MAG: WD40 repeat domain-containing protein [Armatimonadetes bacterium]|nr:WD40 repeat domain-containing protein [Armatimonadota bacterium]